LSVMWVDGVWTIELGGRGGSCDGAKIARGEEVEVGAARRGGGVTVTTQHKGSMCGRGRGRASCTMTHCCP
jgi:hypothetical protein